MPSSCGGGCSQYREPELTGSQWWVRGEGGGGGGGGRAGPKQWNVLLISQVVTNPGVSPLGEWGRGMGEIRGDQQVGGGCLGIEGQLRGDNPRLQ